MRQRLSAKGMVMLLFSTGCIGPFSRGRKPVQPPDLSEQRVAINTYKETRRQALFVASDRIKTAGVTLETIPVAPNYQSDINSCQIDIKTASELLDAVIAIDGSPIYPVDITDEGVVELKALVKDHGKLSNTAEREEQKIHGEKSRWGKHSIREAASGVF